MTSATIVSLLARPETRWCSRSLSVRMPASLPASSTGICEMPCWRNSSVARSSRVVEIERDDLLAALRADDVAHRADLPVALDEPLLAHPAVVGELGEVVADRVGQDHDDALARPEIAAHLHRRPHRGARRAAAQEALLPDQLARGQERVAIVGLDPAVDQPAIEHVGDEVVADALDLVAADLARGRRGSSPRESTPITLQRGTSRLMTGRRR